ncbi:MAG: methyltransferase domain-containing protein [Bacteroidota bacterium]
MKNEKDANYSATKDGTALDQHFWNTQWEAKTTGWDIGYAAPAIEEYVKTIEEKAIVILIPGCGNAYEAELFVKLGFQNITLIDIAPKAVEILQEKFNTTPQVNVLCADFFQHEGQYDLIIEQTFFCALPTSERSNYAKKMSELLTPQGKLAGLLFNRTFEKQGPPFGGSASEYRPLFEPFFTIDKMAITDKSIPQRKGTELFIEFTKK